MTNTIPVVERIFEDYYFIKLLGKGRYGSTYLVTYQGQNYALKLISIKQLGIDGTNKFLKEAQILQFLNHPNIVKCIKYFRTMFFGDAKYALLLEYRSGFNLEKYLETNKLDNAEIEYILINLVEAFKYLHIKGVVHRDVKPANIIYDPICKHVTVVDFGFAGFFTLKKSASFQLLININKHSGSPLYMAPELVNYKLTDIEKMDKAEIWSLGITAYYLYYRTEPYLSYDLSNFRILMKNPPRKNLDPKMPIKIKEFIEKTLVKDVEERIDIFALEKLCLE